MTVIGADERRTRSQDVVDACLSRAEELRYHGVTIKELCGASGVSERRIRDAFHDCHGMPPTAYLRAVALRKVRHVLLASDEARDAVTRAACDHGFRHLSRFAGHYRALFGEAPSATVTRARATARLGLDAP
jgi:transcriptional regulator GlxA family with amidase domain